MDPTESSDGNFSDSTIELLESVIIDASQKRGSKPRKNKKEEMTALEHGLPNLAINEGSGNSTSEQVLPNRAVKETTTKSATERSLFGDKITLIASLEAAAGQSDDVQSDEEDRKAGKGEDGVKGQRKRRPAWVDEDDEEDRRSDGKVKRAMLYTGATCGNLSYRDRIRKNFHRFMPEVKWAKFDQESSEDEELLTMVGLARELGEHTLRPKNLAYKLMKDVNRDGYAEGVINCMLFFPRHAALFVAGQSGYASVYRVNRANMGENLHRMQFKEFPIKCAQNDFKDHMILGSGKRMYVDYDFNAGKHSVLVAPNPLASMHNFVVSPCGKYIAAAGRDGELHLIERNHNELIHTFKQEDCCSSIRFTGDSQHIICNSRSPNVTVFSLRQRRVEHIFADYGCVKGETLDLSPNGHLLATGSREGVVNVYNMSAVLETQRPEPMKSFQNLKTAITDLRFSPNGETLAMSSVRTPGALKLAHMATHTVYANFPPANQKLGNVRVMAFSPHSAYLALGTTQRSAKLVRLVHYKEY